jgi:hypothetical protein
VPHFHRALEIARRQGALSFELRAAMSLHGALRLAARQAESRAVLAEVYGRFRDGFDTADLTAARRLLEQP